MLSNGNGVPTVTTGTTGTRDATRQLVTHARSLVQLELELAKLEVKRKAAATAVGAGLGATAAMLGFLMVAFLFAAAAAGLATQLPVWASILIVAGVLGLLAAAIGLIAYGILKKGAPPVPEQAIEEARRTKDAVQRV